MIGFVATLLQLSNADAWTAEEALTHDALAARYGSGGGAARVTVEGELSIYRATELKAGLLAALGLGLFYADFLKVSEVV